MYCTGCGNLLPSDAVFCSRCGTQRAMVDSRERPPEVTAPAPNISVPPAPLALRAPARRSSTRGVILVIGATLLVLGWMALWGLPVITILGHSITLSQVNNLCSGRVGSVAQSLIPYVQSRCTEVGAFADAAYGALGVGGALFLGGLIWNGRRAQTL